MYACAWRLLSQSRRKVDVAASRLEAAFNKSKSVFLEEAEDILRSTLSSPTTSKPRRDLGKLPTARASLYNVHA